jgi:hypothetical protein
MRLQTIGCMCNNVTLDQEAPNDFGWKHAKVYLKSCRKYQVKKEVVFHENIRKYIQILHKFHFETIEPLIGFILN